MTVADYTLALIALAICVAGIFGSFLVTLTSEFAQSAAASGAQARKGCISMVAALIAAAWLAGVLANGDWGWLR